MQKYIVAGIVLLLLATAVFAQVPAAPIAPTNPVLDPVVAEVLRLAQDVINQVKAGNGMAFLGAIVALLMALVKTPWGQGAAAWLLRTGADWKPGKQQKLVIVFALACATAYFTIPGDAWYKIVGRSVNIALAAVGLHQVVRNFLLSKADEDAE